MKIAKYSLLSGLLLALTLLYFVIAQFSQDKSFGNKVSRVLQIINEKSREGDLGNINDEENPDPENNDIEEKPAVDSDEKEGDDGPESESEDWEEVVDPANRIMDAKVMKKGQQKIIIVDVPNPKARWVKPEHESND